METVGRAELRTAPMECAIWHTLTTEYQSGDCEPSTGRSGCTTDRWLFRPPLGMQVRGYTPTISLILLPTDQNPLFRLIKNVGLCRVTPIATSFEETTFDNVDTGERIPRAMVKSTRVGSRHSGCSDPQSAQSPFNHAISITSTRRAFATR